MTNNMAEGLKVVMKCNTNTSRNTTITSGTSGKLTCKYEESATLEALNTVVYGKHWTAHPNDNGDKTNGTNTYFGSIKSNEHFKAWTTTSDTSGTVVKSSGSNPITITLPANNISMSASSAEHQYTTKTIGAWCTTYGYVQHDCSCGYSYKDNWVNPLGHNYNTWDEPVNCTGVWHRYKCTRCGDTSPTYHTGYDNHDMQVTAYKAPTCTSSGYRTYTCSHGCGYTYTNTLSALGHNYKYETICSGTATCHTYRVCYNKTTCSRCDYISTTYPSQYKDSNNHTGPYSYHGEYIPLYPYTSDPHRGQTWVGKYCNGCNTYSDSWYE